jgi:hypothetical protein
VTYDRVDTAKITAYTCRVSQSRVKYTLKEHKSMSKFKLPYINKTMGTCIPSRGLSFLGTGIGSFSKKRL